MKNIEYDISDLGTIANAKVTMSDFPLQYDGLEYTEMQDKQHFLKAAFNRGCVGFVARGIKPFHAVRVECNGTVYYGTADEHGNAALLPSKRA